MQTSTTNAIENKFYKKIKFADFGVDKAWHFSMYNIRQDFIFEITTLMGTHQVK